MRYIFFHIEFASFVEQMSIFKFVKTARNILVTGQLVFVREVSPIFDPDMLSQDDCYLTGQFCSPANFGNALHFCNAIIWGQEIHS